MMSLSSKQTSDMLLFYYYKIILSYNFEQLQRQRRSLLAASRTDAETQTSIDINMLPQTSAQIHILLKNII